MSRKENKPKAILGWATLFALGALVAPQSAYSFGSAPPKPSPSPAPTTPNPARPIVPRHVQTKIFQLPNGQNVNLDFDSFLMTAVTQSKVFLPEVSAAGDSGASLSGNCASHLELSANVTALELDLYDGTITGTVGFGSGGALPGTSPVNLNGNVQVHVGRVDMDFGVWDCQADGSCVERIASTSSSLTLGLDVTFTVNFLQGTTQGNVTATLVTNPDFANAIQTIMNDGMKQITQSPSMSSLPWSATVVDFDVKTGQVRFDAGANELIKALDVFTVYALDPQAPAQCPAVYRSVANIHASLVESDDAYGVVDHYLPNVESGGLSTITVGDQVRIRVAP